MSGKNQASKRESFPFFCTCSEVHAIARQKTKNAGNNRLVGASGNDVIVGGIGNATMHDGGGNDVITLCASLPVIEIESFLPWNLQMPHAQC